MSEDLRSYPVPNLIQGVSQQNSEQRRETQAEAQFDCVNRPVNGVEARPPVEVLGIARGLDFTNAHCHEIARGDEEHYLAVFTATGSPKVRVYDLITGGPCAVTLTAPQTYLSTVNQPRDVFRTTTLNDFTFLVNKDIKPRMDPDALSPAAKNEGIIYFRAGGYSITYVLKVTTKALPAPYLAFSNKVYVFKYTTPNNSSSSNAKYIATNQLAAIFYKALTNTEIPLDASGADFDSADPRTDEFGTEGAQGVPYSFVSAEVSGEPPDAPITLLGAGFHVRINGNVILIGRNDTGVFTVDTTDGGGDTHFRAVKDQVQDFNDLPDRGFINFIAKVKGTNRETDDDYWVQFKGATGASGYWEECAKPGVEIELDAHRMCHVLVNTGYQRFEWKRNVWGKRVSGDGLTKSKNPSFVGKRIEDIFESNNRLAMMTEGSVVWSKNRNSFVYFQTSAQVTLDTDPVDVEVGGGDSIALLRRAVKTNDSLFFWAAGLQFRVATRNEEGFSEKSVDIQNSSAYEFAPNSRPRSVGKSLYFVSEPGPFAVVRDITYREGGKLVGETDVTAHVPRYIPKGVRIVAGSDALGFLVLHSDQTPNLLYVYNFLVSEQERLQSAWNIWRLPSNCRVVWAGLRFNKLNLLIQRAATGREPKAALICRVDLSVNATDPGHNDMMIRADLRIPDGLIQRTRYSGATDTTRLYMPFPIPEARKDKSLFYVVTRKDDTRLPPPLPSGEQPTIEDEDGGGPLVNYALRGYEWPIVSIAWDSTVDMDVVTVKGNAFRVPLYLGYKISAEREESEFHVRTSTGVQDVEGITVSEMIYGFANTGYTRAVVTEGQYVPKVVAYEYVGRQFGNKENVADQIVLANGFLKIPINKKSTEYKLRLINDSFLPSRWTSLKVHYRAAVVARSVAGNAGRGK